MILNRYIVYTASLLLLKNFKDANQYRAHSDGYYGYKNIQVSVSWLEKKGIVNGTKSLRIAICHR